MRPLLFFVLGLSAVAVAQEPQWFLDARKSPMPQQMAETKALFCGDVTADGLPDLLVGNVEVSSVSAVFFPEHGSYILRNLGGGRFAKHSAVPPNPANQQLFLGLHDMDADGDLDAVYHMGIGENDGAGGFDYREVVTFQGWRAVIGDLGGSNLPDVFTGHALYLNQGGLTFHEVSMESLVPMALYEVPALGIGDLDGDGDQDLVVGHPGGGQTQLLLNEAGVFTDQTPGRMPADTDDTRALLVVDVEPDGDLDLVLANHGEPLRIYANSGSAVFTDHGMAPGDVQNAVSLAAGDVDQDGDLDLTLGLEAGGRILVNQGGGVYVYVPPCCWDPGTQPSSALVLEDLDQDGDLDLVQGSGQQPNDPSEYGASFGLENHVFFNDGRGKFVGIERLQLGDLDDASCAVGDLDADGDRDILFVEGGGGVWFNDGWGGFTQAPLSLPVSGKPLLGKLDGDDDVDAIVLDVSGGFHVLDNPGNGLLSLAGSYSLPPLPAGSGVRAGALGDLDQDGDLDLFAVTGTETISFPFDITAADSVWLNNGSGRFVPGYAMLPTVMTNCREVVLGDLDNDGDLDAVTDGGLIYMRGPSMFTTVSQAIFGNWGETHWCWRIWTRTASWTWWRATAAVAWAVRRAATAAPSTSTGTTAPAA